MGAVEYYVIGVNAISLMLGLINMWLYRYTKQGQIDILVTAASFMGGATGVLLLTLLFDRKIEKSNAMFRVFIACLCVVQVVIFLIVKGYHAEQITLNVGYFFGKHTILSGYMILINIATFIAFAVDKMNAVGNRQRIKVAHLLGMAFIGGSAGALLAIHLFRHKTRKDYFMVGIPMIMAMQVIVIFYVMNSGW